MLAKRTLHRYMAEFDYRYKHTQDGGRGTLLASIDGIKGKRLTYWWR